MDTPNSPIDIKAPNYEKKYANLHYMSEATGEVGCIEIRPKTTAEDALTQYATKFPKEFKMFMRDVKRANQELHSPNGMSKNRSMMAIAKIPEVIFCSMKFICGEDVWETPGAFINFAREFPKFMIGDHRKKTTKGVIIK